MLKLKILLINFFLIFSKIEFINSLNTNDYDEVRVKNLEEIARKINETLNSEVDLCENFYNYVCSKDIKSENQGQQYEHYKLIELVDYEYIKNLNVTNPKVSKSEIKLKTFIESCHTRNQNYLEQLQNLNIAKSIDGWPFYTKNWNGEKMNLGEIYGKLNRYGILTNFQILHIPHENYVILGINPDLLYHENDIVTELQKLNITTDLYNLQNTAKDITQLNEKIIPFFMNFNENHQYENFTINQLNEKIPEFDWMKLFEMYFDLPIPNDFIIRVNSFEKLQKFINFMNTYDKAVLANYVMFKLIVNDEYPWSSNDDCKIDNFLYVFNPIVAKIEIQKSYTKFNQQFYLEALEEIINLLNKLNEHSLVRPPAFKTVNARLNTDNLYITTYGDTVIENYVLDKFYSDMIFKPNNYLQNFYNYKAKKRSMNMNEKQSEHISKMFNFFGKILKIQNKPSLVVFNKLKKEFIDPFVADHAPGNFKPYLEAMNCLNQKSGVRAEVKEQTLYNEGLHLTIEAYKNWLKKNSEIKKIENEILSKFNFNHENLFVLFATQEMCPNLHYWAGNFGKILYSDISEIMKNCPEDKKISCTVFKIENL